MTRWNLDAGVNGEVYFDDDDPISSMADDLDQAQQRISEAYAEFYGVLKAEATSLGLSEQQKRWIDPDRNGLDDIVGNIASVLDDARDLHWSHS